MNQRWYSNIQKSSALQRSKLGFTSVHFQINLPSVSREEIIIMKPVWLPNDHPCLLFCLELDAHMFPWGIRKNIYLDLNRAVCFLRSESLSTAKTSERTLHTPKQGQTQVTLYLQQCSTEFVAPMMCVCACSNMKSNGNSLKVRQQINALSLLVRVVFLHNELFFFFFC